MNNQATDNKEIYFPHFVKANPIASLLDLLLGNPVHISKKKNPNKCLLFECHNLTTHNGGYCCSEHCKTDKERRKNGKKKL